MSDLKQALEDERAAHWVCVEMNRDLRAENERLRDEIERLRKLVPATQHCCGNFWSGHTCPDCPVNYKN